MKGKRNVGNPEALRNWWAGASLEQKASVIKRRGDTNSRNRSLGLTYVNMKPHSLESIERAAHSRRRTFLSETEEHKAARIKACSDGRKLYNLTHRDEVLRIAQDPERRRKISETQRAQFARGERTAPYDPFRMQKHIRTNRRGIGGHFYSRKAGAIFYYRSSWEKELFEFLESHRAVERFEPEVAVCPYEFEQKVRDFIIDVFVDFIDHSAMLIEVKPSCFCVGAKGAQCGSVEVRRNMAKIKAARKWSVHLGLPFILVTNILSFKDWFNERYGGLQSAGRRGELECSHCQVIKSSENSLARMHASELRLLGKGTGE